jgi:uncharacterized protein YbjT (DUF2867 family)
MTASKASGRRRASADMPSMLLAGGTGTVGREIVAGLNARGITPRVLSRDPESARRVLGASVEIVQGDLMQPPSLTAAMRGVEVAYIATTPGPDLAEQEANFLEAARGTQVRRLVKLSGYGTDQATDLIHRLHASSEQRIKSSGLGHVILQPVMFMSNLLWEAASIKQGAIASSFGVGRMSFIDPRDVAEVALVALTELDAGDGVWAFGGPEPLSYDDVAATFSRVLARRVEHIRLDEQRFREAAARLSDFVVEAILSSARLAQAGKYEVPDDLVQDKLGRRAARLESWIAAQRAAFVE